MFCDLQPEDEKEEPKSSKDKSKKDKKQKTLIDEMKEQVQRKLETELRRKAAIEEMMARELERRVGPPRKRSPESDMQQTVWDRDSKRPRISDDRYSSRRSRDEHCKLGMKQCLKFLKYIINI